MPECPLAGRFGMPTAFQRTGTGTGGWTATFSKVGSLINATTIRLSFRHP